MKNDQEIWEHKAHTTKRDYDALHNETRKILYIIEKKEKEMNLMRDRLKLADSSKIFNIQITWRRNETSRNDQSKDS